MIAVKANIEGTKTIVCLSIYVVINPVRTRLTDSYHLVRRNWWTLFSGP